MKIRRKKDKNNAKQHPQYMAGANRNWTDDEREKGEKSVKRSFWAIIALCAIIAIIVVVVVATAVTVNNGQNQQTISAADTFAVSQREQNQMQDTARTFATGLLLSAYCSDQQVASDGRNAALGCMALDTESYKLVEKLPTGKGTVASENFSAIVTDPSLSDGSQSYAGTYNYEFDGTAADLSIKTESNPEGTLIDSGYHFSLVFSKATAQDGEEERWVIASATITKK